MREGRNCLAPLVAAGIALVVGATAAQALPSASGFAATMSEPFASPKSFASEAEQNLILVADAGSRDGDSSQGGSSDKGDDSGKRAKDDKQKDSGSSKDSKGKGAAGAGGSGDARSAGSTSAADGAEGTTVSAEASAIASATLEPGQEIASATSEAWSESTVTSSGIRTVATAVAEVTFDGGISAAAAAPREIDRAALSARQEERGDHDPSRDAISGLGDYEAAAEIGRVDSAALSETVPHW